MRGRTEARLREIDPAARALWTLQAGCTVTVTDVYVTLSVLESESGLRTYFST